MKVAQYLPSPAFKLWHHIPRLFLAQDGSATAISGEMVAKFSAMLSPSSGKENNNNRLYIEEHYGLTVDQQNGIDSAMMQSMLKENTVGANSEAMQCLRKKPDTWGKCDDYNVFVKDLVGSERQRERVGAPLDVQVYFAQEDSMIGNQGQKYFERCWQENGDLSDVLTFKSTTIPSTDHDTLAQSAKLWEAVFGGMQGVRE